METYYTQTCARPDVTLVCEPLTSSGTLLRQTTASFDVAALPRCVLRYYYILFPLAVPSGGGVQHSPSNGRCALPIPGNIRHGR